MKLIPRFFLLSFCASLALLPSLHAEEPISLPGADGESHTPLVVPEDKKATVLFFVSPFCNTAGTLMPEIIQISADFGEDFAFCVVHAEPGLKITDVLAHSTIFEVQTLAVLDENLALAKKTGATITPEAVVISPDGSTLYQGRINDLYLGPTQRQQEATTHDLRAALEAIQAEKEPNPAKVDPVGCKISGLSS